MSDGTPKIWSDPEVAVSSIFLAAKDCSEASSSALAGSREAYSFGLATLMLSCAAVEAFLNAWCRRQLQDLPETSQTKLLEQIEDRNFSFYKKLIDWPRTILGATLPNRATDHAPFTKFVGFYELRADLMHFKRTPEEITSGRFVFDHMVDITKLKIGSTQAKEIYDSSLQVIREILNLEFSRPGYPEDIEASFHAWTGRG